MKDFVTKLLSTLVTVIVAVGVSAAIWIVANLFVNWLRNTSRRATILARALFGFVVASLLSGNRLTNASVTEPDASLLSSLAHWVWLPILTVVVLVIFMSVAERQSSVSRRTIAYGASVAIVGAGLAATLVPSARPRVDIFATAVSTLLVGGLFGVLVALSVRTSRNRTSRRSTVIRAALLGTAAGIVLGVWGFGQLGAGKAGTTVLIGALAGSLLGIRWSLAPDITAERRNATERRARATVFLMPALGFIAIALVVPSLRTIYLSFLDRKSKNFVGLDNYVSIFRDPKSWDMSNVQALWTSRLTIAAVACFVIFAILAIRSYRRSGHVVEFGSPSAPPLALGVLFAGFAVFSTLRGTLINNLWWVFVVTIFSTGIGLLIAVLADGVKFERFAKAIIFMPLAVSMVGASVIWRLVYISRDSTKPQSGTLNALWVGLGRLSTGAGIARLVVGGIVLAATVFALLTLVRSLVRREWTRAAPATAILGAGVWFSLRYWQIVGGGLGGFRIGKSGEVVSDPINFLQEPPFNNFWLMVVLIWIQTGFAMVIFSAAIRAVPRELTEAARVDGASTQSIFWRITLPQIGPTIGVVATTIVVLVMKVFDISKVMTNGNFGTEVLANNMYREAFYNLDIGLGTALAVLIFVSVLPIMYINIRRMNRSN